MKMKHKMTRSQKIHKFQNCCKKILYETLDAADAALIKYSFNYVFSSMHVYECLLHQGFHLGHDYHMSNSDILSYNRTIGQKFGTWRSKNG